MMPSDFFAKLQASIPQLEKTILDVMEIETENFVAANFRDGGFYDGGFQKWQPRKKEASPPYAPLVRTGDLKKSATTASRRGKAVQVVMNQPYAQRHNEGLSNMPKRQFIGESDTLNALFQSAAKKAIKNHINSL
jgi:phage gpG-like protein